MSKEIINTLFVKSTWLLVVTVKGKSLPEREKKSRIMVVKRFVKKEKKFEVLAAIVKGISFELFNRA